MRVGSEAYMTEALYLVAPMLQSAAREMNERGETAVFVAVNGKVTSADRRIADTVRETSKQAIAELNRLGKSTSMASGDSDTTANAIAGEVGISTVYAGLRPLAKQERIRDLVEENNNVVMVGDGINDSPCFGRSNGWGCSWWRYRYREINSGCDPRSGRPDGAR